MTQIKHASHPELPDSRIRGMHLAQHEQSESVKHFRGNHREQQNLT